MEDCWRLERIMNQKRRGNRDVEMEGMQMKREQKKAKH